MKRETAPPPSVAAPRETAKPVAAKEETRIARADASSVKEPPHAGWIVQVGASNAQAKANALLSRAQSQARALAGAKPFTEKFVKGGDTFYRARFAGLDASGAEQACRSLRRSGGFWYFRLWPDGETLTAVIDVSYLR